MQSTLSSLFASADNGEPPATTALFSALYAELHRLAGRQLARSAPGATLGATSLLHEAYLDMVGREGTSFPDRARFLGYASRVMRGLIIDYVRQRKAQKRGGLFEITAIRTDEPGLVPDVRMLSRLSDALDELATTDEHLARIVDLKFFCGFSFVEIAAMSGMSERTVQRAWDKARIYLRQVLQD